MKTIWARIQSEPALVSGFIAAALALIGSFGVNLNADQIGTILAIVSAGLALLVRSQVTPTANLPATPVVAVDPVTSTPIWIHDGTSTTPPFVAPVDPVGPNAPTPPAVVE
jgi:hypothetical protein